MAVTARSLIADNLGVEETNEFENREANDIDTADKIIARNDPARLALLIVNQSDNQLNLRPGLTATTSTGFVLPGNGDTLLVTWRDDLHMVTREWHGIAAGANSACYVLEVTVAGVQPIMGTT
jgi:hypothetical protein